MSLKTIDNIPELSVLQAVYPVGSIYINGSVSTNPSVLLGFGTWTAFGTGKVLVCRDSGDTAFDTMGETGGSKTHTLTTAQLPSHSHTIHSYTGGTTVPAVSGINRSNAAFVSTIDAPRADRTTNAPTDSTGTLLIGNTGSGEAHNILQPYIVVSMWLRSA